MTDERPAPLLVATIRANLERVRTRIAAVGVDPATVTVVGVTKRHPPEVALAALAAGIVDLGENYAQELAAKATAVGPVAARIGLPAPRWHMVGQLQTNKIRLIAPHVSMVQSVDRASVVLGLAKRCADVPILLQVDLSGVAGRGGAPAESIAELLDLARGHGLAVEGLMVVGPSTAAEPDVDLRRRFEEVTALASLHALGVVSMGMSSDLDAAVAAGSTMVRLGTVLFGPRVS